MIKYSDQKWHGDKKIFVSTFKSQSTIQGVKQEPEEEILLVGSLPGSC